MLSMGPREHVLCVGTSVEPVSVPRFSQKFDLLVGSDGSLWVRLRVRVRLGGGLHGTRRGEGDSARARGSQMLCYVMTYVASPYSCMGMAVHNHKISHARHVHIHLIDSRAA